MKKTRKRYPVPEKVAILKRHLVEKVPISDLCDQFHILPSQIYRWQQQLFENAEAALDRAGQRPAKRSEDAKDRKITALEDKLRRKNEVVAEVMEEHVQLKKELGEP